LTSPVMKAWMEERGFEESLSSWNNDDSLRLDFEESLDKY
jgi:hypothetical protein